MVERMHIGTFIAGIVLAAAGVWLTGIGFEWWAVDQIDFRYVTPGLFILIGVIIIAGALRGSPHAGNGPD